ncbi:hypothetical protein [Nostoc sp. UHCC 0870]|nr:hypothetical protein [Nostoc sp. UHCC 0870]UKP00929.1 hypothetical protein L6494_04470 [Nostoc sp. UHCC 0870]
MQRLYIIYLVRTQVAQYGVLILAYLIPAVAIAWKLTGNPSPQSPVPND